MTSEYEDFLLEGAFSLSAINLNEDGNIISYSRTQDIYQYRKLLRVSPEEWVEMISSRGPTIDRRTHRIFICTALHDLDLGKGMPP